MKSQLTTWCFLGAVAYVLLSAFHGCMDARLNEGEAKPPAPTQRKPAEPVEVRAPQPTGPVAPVQIGLGAAESLAIGQAAEVFAQDERFETAASMQYPPPMAEEAPSGPLAERMAAVFEDDAPSSSLSMHVPPLFDDMAAPEEDFAAADFAEEAAARNPENPDIAALSAQLERQRQTIAELKREIGVLRAAKEDLLDEVDQLQEQAGDQEGTANPASAGPVEDEADGDRDMARTVAESAGAATGRSTQLPEEDCGCDERPPAAPMQ